MGFFLSFPVIYSVWNIQITYNSAEQNCRILLLLLLLQFVADTKKACPYIGTWGKASLSAQKIQISLKQLTELTEWAD